MFSIEENEWKKKNICLIKSKSEKMPKLKFYFCSFPPLFLLNPNTSKIWRCNAIPGRPDMCAPDVVLFCKL